MKRKTRVPKHWLWLLVPYVWDVLLIPFVNQVKIRPFGVPFLLIWMLFGVVLVSICLGIVYKLDVTSRGRE